ncbi:hypothetical protein BDW02DRAFT_197677 [Decorospora gaudefroyi]|uniref:Uncharacterized protein n=1 Tax=Decorospora gaudefroyi TaxID=184978 RepID=A0A6A5KM80_9PLEO|nr:hypothetical protein BDW02DRAFT_197677 [Decorospora gaudefroyi]
MDRRINIVDDDEVARAMAMAAEGKKGKGKKKAIDGGAFKSSTSNKSASLPEPKRKVVATGTHPTGTRFYEAYGLKIPLFDNSGKRRPNARLSKSLTRHSVVELLDIVAQIAGDDKKEELRNKGLPKAKLANWIEEKETLALGRHPISELPLPGPVKNDAEQIGGSASLLTPTTPVTIKLTMKPTAATSVINTREGKLESAAGGDDTGHHPGDKKRRAQDEAPRGQPHQKHQKRHRQANLETITTDTSAKGNQTSKPDNDSTSTSAQTKAQTKAYTHTSDKAHRKFAFMEDVGMHPDDPDRSTMVVRGRSQSRILTATKRTMRDTTDQVTLHQVSGMYSHMS